MNKHSKIAISIVIIGLVIVVVTKLYRPQLEDTVQRESSDARATKGKIIVGYDNWIGYYPLCSSEMRKRMRHEGYVLSCKDDAANYVQRLEALKKGDLQFAVATIDSYLINGASRNFPGTMVAVIDESKGGDAIVAWKDKINSLDTLKTAKQIKIAFTPNSPSEHLLKSMAVHFDVPGLLGQDNTWRVETNGSEDALKTFLKKQVGVAVLWEPDVSRALQNKGVIKLLGTEDTDKLIVDILVVNRKYSQREPEAVKTLLKEYFRTLKYYRDTPEKLIEDASADTHLGKDVVKTMLHGVSWVNLSSNAVSWFGLPVAGASPTEGLVDAIDSTVTILMDHGDFTRNPIPDADAYRLINSKFASDLFSANINTTQFGKTMTRDVAINKANSLERAFDKLSTTQWDALREIGTLKVRPIVFQSGVNDLTLEGKEELDKAVENLKHYPNFRIVIKGHTGLRGDPNANKLLSQHRAEAVARYFSSNYGIDVDRMRPMGIGSGQPLARKPGETDRAYNYRLPRVELFLVTEDI